MGDRLRDLLLRRLAHLKSTLFPGVPDEKALAEVVDRTVAATVRLHYEREEKRERLDELGRRKGAAQAALTARNKRGYQGPATVMALVDLAVRERLRDPEASYQWADAAAYVAERDLKEPTHQGLRARALAERGNAQRLREEFHEGRRTLEKAEKLAAPGHSPVFRGEVFALFGSLETSAHRVEQALLYIDKALASFRGAKLPSEELLNRRAHLLIYKGELALAVEDLGRVVEAELKRPRKDPEQLLTACHNGLYALAEIALTTQEASERSQATRLLSVGLNLLRPLYQLVDSPRGLPRRLWLQGRMHLAAGAFVAAGEVLEQALTEFLRLEQAATAAVVSLDLSLVLARKGDLQGLRETAAAACAIFEMAGLEPDLWASVRVLRSCDRATEAEVLILEALKRLGGASLRRPPAHN